MAIGIFSWIFAPQLPFTGNIHIRWWVRVNNTTFHLFVIFFPNLLNQIQSGLGGDKNETLFLVLGQEAIHFIGVVEVVDMDVQFCLHLRQEKFVWRSEWGAVEPDKLILDGLEHGGDDMLCTWKHDQTARPVLGMAKYVGQWSGALHKLTKYNSFNYYSWLYYPKDIS